MFSYSCLLPLLVPLILENFCLIPFTFLKTRLYPIFTCASIFLFFFLFVFLAFVWCKIIIFYNMFCCFWTQLFPVVFFNHFCSQSSTLNCPYHQSLFRAVLEATNSSIVWEVHPKVFCAGYFTDSAD